MITVSSQTNINSCGGSDRVDDKDDDDGDDTDHDDQHDDKVEVRKGGPERKVKEEIEWTV